MKKEKMDILKEEIIIPDVVTDALEGAYAKILEETAAPEQNGKVVAMKKKDRPGFKKKWIAVALVAVLAVGTFTVGSATGTFNAGLLKYMGVENTDTAFLTADSVHIDASDTCNGIDYTTDKAGVKKDVTFTVTESIGDDTTAYIRIDTDFEVPADFDARNSELVVDTSEFRVCSDKSMTPESMVYYEGALFKTTFEDNKLSILIHILDCENINDKYVRIGFENIYLASTKVGEEDVLLYEGNWMLQWQYDYMTQDENTVSFVLDDTITMPWAKARQYENSSDFRKGLDLHLTHISISPLTMTIEGEVNFDLENEFLEEQGFLIEQVKYTDGTVIPFDMSRLEDKTRFNPVYEYNAFLSYEPQITGNRVTAEIFLTDLFGQSLDVEKLESITINGVEIKLKNNK